MRDYKAGDIVNGHVWTGHSWVPVSEGVAVAPPPEAAPKPPAPTRPPRSRESIRRDNVRNGFVTVVGLAWVATVFAFATEWLDRKGMEWGTSPQSDDLTEVLGDFTRGVGFATAPLWPGRWVILGIAVALTIVFAVVMARMPKEPPVSKTPDVDSPNV